jgi:hypothetical protein
VIIVCNGQVLAQAKQFDVQQVQTVVAMVDLDDVCSYRASIPIFGIQSTRSRQTAGQHEFVLCNAVTDSRVASDDTWPKPSAEIALKFHTPEGMLSRYV